MSPVFKAIYSVIFYFPIAVLIAGIIIAIITWRRHPKISLLTIAATILRAFLDWISPYMFGWLQGTLGETQIPPYLWINYYMGWYMIRAVLSTASYILIFITIFCWRNNQPAAQD